MEGTDNGDEAAALDSSFLQQQGQYVGDGGQDDDSGAEDGERGDSEPLREQDRFLPIANVAKIMKRSVPQSGKIAKDAKECVQECVSEFISFVTSEASERCHQEKRKTINGEDILFAMSTLGFDNYVEPLKVYLQKYRESTKGEKVTAEGIAEEVSDEAFMAGTALSGNLLAGAAGQGDQPVIYTTAFAPQQIAFQ